MQNKLVTNYINNAPDYAKPVLEHLRILIHNTCPQVEEKIKWGMPSFEYKGLMCGFAAFKKHCTFGFWKAALMKDKSLLLTAKSEVAMGHLGKITCLKDLPNDKKIINYIEEAMLLNEDGIKIIKSKNLTPKPLQIPTQVLNEIKKNKSAYNIFEAFSASNKREYIDWIMDAKTESTKNKRLAQAIEWMAEGKPRNWKYMKQYQ